jgi:general secretion pathway protein B
MSYILDALKKSEQARSQHASPDRTASSSTHATRPSNRLWILLGCIAIITVAVALTNHKTSDSQKSTININPVHSTQAIFTGSPERPTVISVQAPLRPTPVASPSRFQAVLHPENPTPSNLPDVKKPGLPQTAAVPAKYDNKHPIPTLHELPESTRTNIPPIHIEGHIYDANPAKRMVIINGFIAREGEWVGDHLQLITITADGVLMAYKKTYFHMHTFGH